MKLILNYKLHKKELPLKHISFSTVLLFLFMQMQGCAVQKQLIPTGGSRADGTVKLSFEYGLFESPQLDPRQGLSAAQQRCSSWGYKNAEPFGGSTKICIQSTRSDCVRWLVSVEYQCTEATHPLN